MIGRPSVRSRCAGTSLPTRSHPGSDYTPGRFYGCLFPGIVAVFALAMNSLGIYLASWEAWPVFLVGIGFPLAYIYARRRSFAHAFRQQPILALPQEGELGRDGLRMRSELGEVTIPWHFFVRVKANTTVLLLYEAPHAFVILPRTFFADDADFDAAIECAHVWRSEAKERMRPSTSPDYPS